MLRARMISLLALLMVASAPAQAHELELRAESRIGGDSNIFRRADGPGSLAEVQDGFWEFSPTISVRENVEELQYDFRYKPVFQTFFDTGGLSGWDHTERGRLNWKITDRDTLGISQTYSKTRRIRQNLEQISFDEIVLDETDREQVERIAANGFYSRQWSNVVFSRFGLAYDEVDFSREGNLDTRAYSANTSLNYVPRERWTVGANALGRYRRTDGIGSFQRQNASIANVGLSVAHKFSPTIDLSLQAGPTLIWTKQRFEDLEFDTSFFVAAEILKVWAKGQVSLNYTRSESASQGNGSSILDTVRLAVVHSPIRKFRLTGAFDYTRRDFIASTDSRPAGANRAVETESFSLIGSARYQITPKVHVIGFARFREIQPKGSDRNNPTTVISGYVSLEYVFDAWVF